MLTCPSYLAVNHGGWSFTEAYSLPVVIRRWFLKRLSDQMVREREHMEKANSGKNTYNVGEGPPVGPPSIPRG